MRQLFIILLTGMCILGMPCCENQKPLDHTAKGRVEESEIDKYELIVNIDNLEGLWLVTDFEAFVDGQLHQSTFDGTVYDGTYQAKYQHFLSFILYSGGVCHQLYEEPFTNAGDKLTFLYADLEWGFDKDTQSIVLTNNNIKSEYRAFATTFLKLLHYNNGEFILEGLQPSPYNCKNVNYRLYGKIDRAELCAQYEKKYLDEQKYATKEDPYSR